MQEGLTELPDGVFGEVGNKKELELKKNPHDIYRWVAGIKPILAANLVASRREPTPSFW